MKRMQPLSPTGGLAGDLPGWEILSLEALPLLTGRSRARPAGDLPRPPQRDGAPTYDRGAIDLRLVREPPDPVRASQGARGAGEPLVPAPLAAAENRGEAVGRADQLRADQKAAPKAVKSAPPEERPAVLERAKALAAEVKEAEEAQRAA